jgi:Fe2+ or Zn2+ uptake regulation protein
MSQGVALCLECGRVSRLEEGTGRALAKELARTSDIEVTELRVEIRGLCPACRNRLDRSLLCPGFEEGL